MLKYYADVFLEDLEEAAEILAQRQPDLYKEISERKEVRINC